MSTLSIAPAFDTSDRLRVVRATREPRPARATVRSIAGPGSATARPASLSSSVRTSDVRLTQRGRLVVFLGTLALALATSFFLGAGAVGTEESGTPAPTEIVMVGTGDTLWGIASEVADGRDVRDVMTEIERLNALESPGLMAGQKLRVPLGE